MSRSQADLGLTATVAVLACAAAAVSAPVAVTAVLGILILAAPGYLLGELLFGAAIEGLERVAVAAGLALCVPILGGLILYAAGVQLHRATWLGLLAGLTLACDLVLLWRRRSGRAASFGWAPRRLPRRHAMAFGAAVAIAVCAVGIARAGVVWQHYPGFTQLWLVRSQGNAASVNLGVANHEGKTARYRLVLLRNFRPAGSWNLTLANGQTWHRSPSSSGRRISVKLYKLPELAHSYRYVAIDGSGAQ
ncbi:MAG: hypothetical protein ACLQK8_26310 [Streptosporangiaceae bacterium]